MDCTSLQLEEMLKKEWLETNGLGGYASSTILGANTRKYHGLLVASLNPPTDRKVLIAKIEEKVLVANSAYEISVNQYPGTIHPHGYQYLQSFKRKPIPTWHYKTDKWELLKKTFMVPNSNTTVVVYEHNGETDVVLELHPLMEFKDYHWTMRQNDFDFYYEKLKSGIKIYPFPNSLPIYMGWSKGDFLEDRAWFYNIELP